MLRFKIVLTLHALDSPGLKTIKEVAEVLAVSRQTIYRAMENAGISDLSKNGQVFFVWTISGIIILTITAAQFMILS